MRDALGIPRSIIVLGGTSEIALATAGLLIDRGSSKVILAGRSMERLERAAVELGTRSNEASIITAEFDASQPNLHEDLLQSTDGEDIDAVLVACGSLARQEDLERDPRAARELVEANFSGVVSATVPLVARMVQQGHGKVIALSSVAAERPRASEYFYCAAKAGMDAYFRGLDERLRGTGVSVMVVRPGFVTTKMTEGYPTPPWATNPDAVARVIARGLDRDARLIWAPGWLRAIMAILRVLPSPLFRKLTEWRPASQRPRSRLSS